MISFEIFKKIDDRIKEIISKLDQIIEEMKKLNFKFKE